MMISTKLSLSLSLVALLMFGAFGLYLVGAEERDLRTSAAREISLVGRSLQVAAENAIRDRQLADIQEAMEKLESIQANVDILFYDPDGQVIASSGSADSTDPLFAQVLQNAVAARQSTLRFEPATDPERVVLGMPLTSDDGELVGRMIVVRSLDDLRRDLAATKRGIALAVGLFVLITAVLSVLLGSTYIGRPLDRMMQAMSRVRHGDFASTLKVDGLDEVGRLTEEFNIMLKKLQQARQKLEEEAEAKRRLERLLQQADKLVTIGQLSAGLAHEIGSPLQVLNGRARALLASPHNPEETRRNAEILVSQTDRIALIVDQLLQVTRRRTPQLEAVDLTATVRTVADLMQVEAERRQVSLSIVSDPATPTVQGDANGIQQVALNLVANAIVATPAGGRVTISLGRSTLASAASQEPRPAAELVVEDTGCGIPVADRERIFEPFFTTRSTEGGTGLGLAVVKAIITEHRGTISVDSRPGAGSRFAVALPVGELGSARQGTP
jgi:signal transduction histidine kinase